MLEFGVNSLLQLKSFFCIFQCKYYVISDYTCSHVCSSLQPWDYSQSVSFFVVLFSCWTNNSWAVTRGEPGCALNEDTIIFKNTKNGFAYGTFGHWKRSCLSDLFDAFLIGLPCSRVDRPYQQLFIFSHASLHNLLFRFKLCVKSVWMTFEAVECEAFARTWQT